MTGNTIQAPAWLQELEAYVGKKHIVLFRFRAEEWQRLETSRHGTREFTIARPHDLLEKVKVPTACLFEGHGGLNGRALYFGVASSRQAVTTLESRIKIKRAIQISPDSETELRKLIVEQPHSRNLGERLDTGNPVVSLPSGLSSHIVQRLASFEANHGPMRIVESLLSVPRRFSGNAALQEDAVQSALRAFGLGATDEAISVQLTRDGDTSLARIRTMEDSVVEHDARSVPGYDLMQSDLTGRAVFQRGAEQLEVFTANRRSLEHVFGVDLIYLNVTRQNVVMLQYKMLEPSGRSDDGQVDWIYRPDQQLDAEIRRMDRFCQTCIPSQYEYRLNPGVFYLKFVKRDASIANGGIVVPIDHYRVLTNDPACRGPNGAVRVSFDSLRGRYLRQGPFLGLIQSGYVGAHAETTQHIKVLIDQILAGNRALVAAIQTRDATVLSDDDIF
jgi:hypothetical protein